jgi:DNA ligase-associated metallophosphoesterase
MLLKTNDKRGDAPVVIRDEECYLLSEKALYWRRKRMLLVSDLHLAKSGHFRKAGIPIPTSIHQGDLMRLSEIISRYRPESVLILGDLFHSRQNNEWKQFRRWRDLHRSVKLILVRGNHDSPDDELLIGHGIDVVVCALVEPPFLFTHIRENEAFPYYNISGHVHPSVLLSGRGRQVVSFPCFHFTPTHAVLPSFGRFTGSSRVIPAKNDRVFIVSGNRVTEMSPA